MHIKHIHCAIEKLAEDLKCDTEKGIENMDVEIAGKEADMLKDLCEAEYYARIAKAMGESEEEDEQEAKSMMKRLKEEYGDEEGERMYRMGYNRSRYRDGRFAPKGRGRNRRMGYMPPQMMIPDLEDEYMEEYLDYPDYMNHVKMRMGYDGNRGEEMGMGRNRGERMEGSRDGGSKYGRSYDSYRENRRHFTEMKDEESKRKMRESIDEIFDDMSDMTSDIVKDLTPEEKQKYKKRLETIMQKMV